MPEAVQSLEPATRAVPRAGRGGWCVIYCRVSSAKQKIVGDGLNSQEKRCRDYAALKGYDVLAVFADDINGDRVSRQGLDRLVDFVDEAHRRLGQDIAVIIDDLKRFARDVSVHFSLKLDLAQRGGRLESPLFRFEDTPEGKFIETIVAAQAELERNQNKRQVRNRMQARLENGYWTFKAPAGYRYAQDRVHKKLLVRDEPRASMVAEALEGFAKGRLNGAMDIWREFRGKGFYGPAPGRAQLSRQLWVIHGMLRQPLYTGHLEHKPWGVTFRRGQHEPLITLATYERIQERLREKPRSWQCDTDRPEFALRGFVACASCGLLLTASWTIRPGGRRYPYYHCKRRSCHLYGATVQKIVMDADFEKLLAGVGMSPMAVDALKCLVVRWCRDQEGGRTKEVERKARDLQNVVSETARLTGRAVETTSPAVARALDARLEELAREEAALREDLEAAQRGMPNGDVGTAVEACRPMLENPLLLYQSGALETKRLVLKRVFTSPVPYERGRGVGTAELALPYQLSERLDRNDFDLVDLNPCVWEHMAVLLRNWADEDSEARATATLSANTA